MNDTILIINPRNRVENPDPLVLPGVVMTSFVSRFKVEEEARLESPGDEYTAYQRRTWRLIPGVY